jgi:Ca2+/Na+ antiporter
VAETLAVAGAILLLLSVTGGIGLISTAVLKKEQHVPMGDRVAGTLIGVALIALAAMLQTGYHRWGVWIALGCLAAAVLWYAQFLGRRL